MRRFLIRYAIKTQTGQQLSSEINDANYLQEAEVNFIATMKDRSFEDKDYTVYEVIDVTDIENERISELIKLIDKLRKL